MFPSAAWWLLQSVAFCFGVTNGFTWNRLWTFDARKNASMGQQYPKFFATNAIGLGLNLFITKIFLVIFTGQIAHQQNPENWKVLVASLCAVPVVVVWNFSAARYWTFRAPKTPAA